MLMVSNTDLQYKLVCFRNTWSIVVEDYELFIIPTQEVIFILFHSIVYWQERVSYTKER